MSQQERVSKYGGLSTVGSLAEEARAEIYPNPKGHSNTGTEQGPKIIIGTVLKVKEAPRQPNNPIVIFQPEGGLGKMSLGGGTAAFPLREESTYSLSPTIIPTASQDNIVAKLLKTIFPPGIFGT